jgi:GT2 family glycosyltransferase
MQVVDRLRHPQKLADRLSEPDAVDVSFLVLFDGWVQDLERFHGSVAAQASGNWEVVVIDNPVEDAASERIASLDRVIHVPLRDRVGYGAGRNLALRVATGRIVCVVDTSVEITGPLELDLADESVGLLGRWGVVTDNGFDYEESDGPDVDGVEGYFMAMRRSDVPRFGMFDPKFKFYRNADLDYSFRVRDTGSRTIVDASLPLTRHTHRLWDDTPNRDELSRKNFFRFRDHWGDRADLLTRPR